MKARTLYLLAFYLFTVLVLTLGKPVFMWCNGEGHAFAAADVLRVMGHGLTLDLSTALYLLAVPFLAVLVSIWLHRWKPVRTFLKLWNAAKESISVSKLIGYVLILLALFLYNLDTKPREVGK